LANNALDDPGGAAVVPDSSEAICYASPKGNDLADGSTLRTAKQDVMSCYDTISSGTIFMLDGGHDAPLRACARRDPAGCGIWIMGSGDPNYSRPPAGWRKEKPISFVGGMGTRGEPSSHDYQTNLQAGGSDSKHPGIWLSWANQITFENLSIATCLPAVLGRDSNGNPANGQAWDNVFDNVGLTASRSVGCGPGMFIGSASSRNFIRHSQIRGSPAEQALVAAISRQSNIVTLSASARLPSSWKTGAVVGVVGVADRSFDGGNFTITVTSAKTFTYPQTGPDFTSSGGRASSDGNQAIVVNPHGAQGNSLYADDLSLHDGAIKVYAGTSGTTLDVAKLDQEPGFGPVVWIATCISPTVVYNRDVAPTNDAKNPMLAEVRSDCAKSPEEVADSTHAQNPSINAPAAMTGGAGPPRATTNPPLGNQHDVPKGRPTEQAKAAAPKQERASVTPPSVNPTPSSPHDASIRRPLEQKTAFAVQAGTFRDPVNANHLKAMIGASYGPVLILRSEQGDGLLYRVRVGHESSESAARELAEKLRNANLTKSTLVVKVN
jgi:cell division septation protein DedD